MTERPEDDGSYARYLSQFELDDEDPRTEEKQWEQRHLHTFLGRMLYRLRWRF